MIDNILIPTDGSDKANHAVEYGLGLAEAFDATVHALYVIETKATYIITVDIKDSEMEEYREYGEQTVTDVVEQAGARGLEAKGVVRSGRVPEEVVEYANDNDVDTIVIGKQGHGAFERFIGGSAEKVANIADIPVTVVGPGRR